MLCVVDIGNTNIVAAFMESSNVVCFTLRLISDRNMTKEKFVTEILGLLKSKGLYTDNIHGVMISSVVPELTEIVREGMSELVNASVMVLKSELNTGLIINMDNPDKVGSDLIADAVAAAQEYSGTVAVFDMGTATTCSLVRDGEYVGTIIMPGVAISQNALSEKASQLPRLPIDMARESEIRLMGKNTMESMLSGMIYGNAAMIDGIIQYIEDEEGEITAVATGGISQLIVPHCRKKIIIDNNLLLKGLWYIYNMNV